MMADVVSGTMIDGFISFGAGLVACYYGFRSPPGSSDAAMTAK
jgi:ABC-type transporter Mla maintaining outer membrane lipid asymmetry permease subunit MlaE